MKNLNKRNIQDIDPKCIGSYLLANERDGMLCTLYAGRSDTSLRRRLQEHLCAKKFNRFKIFQADNELESYYKECAIYHSLSDILLENERHPDHPDGCYCACPFCSISPNWEVGE